MNHAFMFILGALSRFLYIAVNTSTLVDACETLNVHVNSIPILNRIFFVNRIFFRASN